MAGVSMRLGAFVVCAILCLTPAASAGDQISRRAIGYICSAEHGLAPPGGERRLVMVPGVGTGGFPIRTREARAQAWFDQGMRLAHAFYHDDAKAAFRRAQAIDPSCAMCVWGEAWAAGPTINYGVDEGEAKADAALATKAARLGGGESAKNRALIAALEVRYASHDAAADVAFAKAMDRIARRYPADDEVAILTSDAWLIPVTQHQDRQGLDRAMAVLEPVLRRHPDDTGAIHFYIHATELAGRPARALPYAERLSALAPAASHLVHMASHTFFRVGRYEDAAVANAQAIAVDGAYLRAAHDGEPQGKVAYHGHDLRFGLGAALASGDGPLALKFAEHAAFAYPGAIADDGPGQLVIAHAFVAYGRYAPDQALALPAPGKDAAFAEAMRHYARGEAFAARGDIAGLRAEAARLAGADTTLATTPDYYREAARAVLQIAGLTLKGRLAMLEGQPKAAAEAYRAAAEIQDAKLTSDAGGDPPPWWYPERRSLAAAFLAAGKPAEAAAEARKALKAWPDEPLTLQVLGLAEQAAGDAAGAARDLSRARRGWRGGAVPLPRI
jgi:tetratricopeptide (TPR) repeat protein